jgi:ATP phosphoribosyltransferase
MKLNGDSIKIAVQRKGRLAQASLDLLRAAGIDFEASDGLLLAQGRNYPLDILFLRDDDIPEYVQDGVTDIGIVGLNVVEEKAARVCTLDYLGFGGRLRTLFDLEGKRIATSYPRTLGRYLEQKGVQARVIELNGSVEIAPALDVAEAICDLVSTGSTLRTHDLVPIEVVLKSEAVLVANGAALADPRKADLIGRLRVRMLSHLKARRTKYVMMNAPESALAEIRSILPGMKSPTIVPLAEPGMIAVHTAVPEEYFWDVIERLRQAGATDLLVVPVEKMVV